MTGRLYAFQHGTPEELAEVWAYLKREFGDRFTGKVYGRQAMEGVEENPKLPENVWQFELKQST